MSIGALEQRYEFELQGIQLPSPGTEFSVPQLGLKAHLQPGTPLILSVRIEGTTQADGERRAALFIQELYRRLLLRFAARIHGAVPPRCGHQVFTITGTDSPPGSVTRVPITGRMTIEGRYPTMGVSAAEVREVAEEARWRFVTPQLPTSAQLYAAIDMFIVGLESPNKVVRFIVFYSALELAALFKWHDGRQEKVDELVQERNSRIPASPSPKKPGKNEGLYTRLRNDLIHAGERGVDPASAIGAIDAHVGQFQRDVSAILSNL